MKTSIEENDQYVNFYPRVMKDPQYGTIIMFGQDGHGIVLWDNHRVHNIGMQIPKEEIQRLVPFHGKVIIEC